METGREQIDLFLKKCDELMQSKFILADTKIGEVLKSIATSDLLYAFFRDITKDFDYPAAQKKYMYYLPEGSYHKRKLLFPEDPVERLAFVFCLLVDFDTGRMDLDAFLQEFFYEDGSVYGSFYAFTNQVVKPFKSAVRTMIRDQKLNAAVDAHHNRAELVRLVGAERDSVYASELSDEKKVDALLILNALAAHAEKGGGALIAALVCGYRYFAKSVGRNSEYIEEMCSRFADPEAAL